ncbi:MAG: LysM peptidoglycan-binding domain-containing protein [Sulfurovum sp.]|nr:LysM peptidoglycan-binding domain-containing protein [Sulfurovum sp.]
MSKSYFKFFLLVCLLSETLVAKVVIDCRVVIGTIIECNPYGAKFLKAKEIVYAVGTQKLIRVKTLAVPEKKKMKVISVADMIEKYVKVEDSIRFKGTENIPLKITVLDETLTEETLRIENTEQEVLEKIIAKKSEKVEGEYTVVSGDVLSRIAKKFGLKTKILANYNNLTTKSTLSLGQKLKLPFDQKMIDAFSSATYTVQDGDTLIAIARMFKLEPKALVKFNAIKSNTIIAIGKVLKLPLPYVLEQIKVKAKAKKLAIQKKRSKLDFTRGFGKRKLRVTATAYSSHVNQTDSTPFIAAWNNRLRPGMRIIAVSRDLLTRYGMKNGTKVRIGGLRGFYRVRDKMNKRYRKRIDIYMGLNRRRALRWGRRSVVIYW